MQSPNVCMLDCVQVELLSCLDLSDLSGVRGARLCPTVHHPFRVVQNPKLQKHAYYCYKYVEWSRFTYFNIVTKNSMLLHVAQEGSGNEEESRES